jgi:ankyrin repeat protein
MFSIDHLSRPENHLPSDAPAVFNTANNIAEVKSSPTTFPLDIFINHPEIHVPDLTDECILRIQTSDMPNFLAAIKSSNMLMNNTINLLTQEKISLQRIWDAHSEHEYNSETTLNLLNVRHAIMEKTATSTPVACDITKKNKDNETLLSRAVSNGDIDTVMEVLRLAPGLCKIRNKEGGTPLMRAAEKGNIKIAELLLPHSNANARDRYGDTAMLFAARNGHIKIVELLLPNADIEAKNNADETVLMSAAENGHSEIVGLLLSRPDVTVPKDNNTPTAHMSAEEISELKIKIAYGYADQVKFLLPTSLVNKNCWMGQTALMIAAKNGHAKIVEQLLPHANINVCDKKGNTAFVLAARYGHTEIVELLLPHTNPNVANCNESSAIILAACYGHNKIVELLLPLTRVDKGNVYGLTALMLAARDGHTETVDLLLPKSDVNARDDTGATALMLAKKSGHAEIVELLSKHPTYRPEQAQ